MELTTGLNTLLESIKDDIRARLASQGEYFFDYLDKMADEAEQEEIQIPKDLTIHIGLRVDSENRKLLLFEDAPKTEDDKAREKAHDFLDSGEDYDEESWEELVEKFKNR